MPSAASPTSSTPTSDGVAVSRISVIQPGARLHYAVPAAFARAGLLRALYTDLHADHAWLRALDRVVAKRAQPKELRRLLGRRLPAALPANKVRDMPLRVLLGHVADRLGRPDAGSRALTPRLLRRLEEAPLGDGDVVYTVLVNEDLETMRRLKDRGVKIVHECMIGPDVGRWVAEERELFPGVEQPEDPAVVAHGRCRDRRKYEIADLVLVPSEFTRNAVEELGSENLRVSTVPYGYDPDSSAVDAASEPGRVLFVGSVGLRKGIPYLAAATRLVKTCQKCIDVHVVGPPSSSTNYEKHFPGPTYRGQIPRATIMEEFRKADIFVLPTICDSFGIVHLESMAAGVPVITTPNCGSVVRDGVDGFIVPIRDPEAIADRVERIVSDRALRAWMSHNARARAAEFSTDRYGERLVAAMAPVLQP